MVVNEFIAIGENIHCTRSVKSGGIRTAKTPEGEAVKFKKAGEDRLLPIPSGWAEISPPYGDGKVRHITLAIHCALNGSAEEQEAGRDYLLWAAQEQIDSGASFLDVNVDEYSIDHKQNIEVMKWLVSFLSDQVETPICLDSSNVVTLTAGLESCKPGKPLMVNSLSLEREDAVDVAQHYKAHAVVSAAGKATLPANVEERMENFRAIVGILDIVGMPREKMFLDALVLPISVDAENAKKFIDASVQAKKELEGVNLSGGLSNVSFGMPNRKLLNMAFTSLFVEAGGNSGIVDPIQISKSSLEAFDLDSEPARLARAVLDGTDLYGAEYIAAFREGRLK